MEKYREEFDMDKTYALKNLEDKFIKERWE
jgi:hypothetical protein